MTYLDWAMVLVTSLSCWSMLFESPWPTNGENLIFNNPYLQVCFPSPYVLQTFAFPDLDHRVPLRRVDDLWTDGEGDRKWPVLHTEGCGKRRWRHYDVLHLLCEFFIFIFFHNAVDLRIADKFDLPALDAVTRWNQLMGTAPNDYESNASTTDLHSCAAYQTSCCRAVPRIQGDSSRQDTLHKIFRM